MKIVVEITQSELYEALNTWLRDKYPEFAEIGTSPEWKFEQQGGGVPTGLRAVKEAKR